MIGPDSLSSGSEKIVCKVRELEKLLSRGKAA
jgi:hypothetical protein